MPPTITDPAGTSEHLRIWANGELFARPDDARVSVVDHGLVVGGGVFEALKVTPEGPFALGRHLARLTRSAMALGIPAPNHSLIREVVDRLIDGRTYEIGKVRITYTGGQGPLGSQRAFGPTSLVVAADVASVVTGLGTIVTAPWTRNERGAMSGLKTTSYAENVRALAFADDRGATEAIFANTAGNLCEGTGSNIFCVFGDRVVTPPLSAGPLAGITRELVLEWSDVEQVDLSLADAQAADEVFLTSSLRDVQSVGSWDGRKYAAGPATQRIAAVFAERAARSLEP